MNLELHNETFVKINLNTEEFNRYFSNVKNTDLKNPHFRFAVNEILRFFYKERLSPEKYENFNINIIEYENAYAICLFKKESFPNKQIDKSKKWLLLFYDFDSMINALLELYRKKVKNGVLYHNKTGYQMIIETQKSKLKKIANFCTITDSKLAIAQVTEYSNKISEKNVIERIGLAFLKK